MAEFPLDPPFSKALIRSKDFNCVRQAISIIAALSVESIFYTPNDKREEAAEMRRKFTSFDGDLITYLNVLEAYSQTGKDKKWCQEHFINSRSLQQVLDIQKQLTQHVMTVGYDLEPADSVSSMNERILQAFLTAFFTNLAVKQVDGSYKTIFTRHIVHIHPSSTLF